MANILQSTQASWHLPGEAVEIQGYTITSGFFYTGTKLPAMDGYHNDASLINPELKICPPQQYHETLAVPGWPEYNSMSPQDRGTYLQWLSEGRKSPHIDIGYIMLFFYGLERRLFIDGARTIPPTEQQQILQEIIRLLNIYRNPNFTQPAQSLLLIEWLLHGDYTHPPEYLLQSLRRLRVNRTIPVMLQLMLGRYIALHQPLPFNLLDYICQFLLYGHLLPTEQKEFTALFHLAYQQHFSQPLLVEKITKRINYTYTFASPSLKGFVGLKQPLPCLPIKLLQEILTVAKSCQRQLATYQHALAETNQTNLSLSALATLPSEILSLPNLPATHIYQQLQNFLATTAMPINLCQLMSVITPKEILNITKYYLTLLRQILLKINYVMAPDPIWHNIHDFSPYIMVQKITKASDPTPNKTFILYRFLIFLLQQGQLLHMVSEQFWLQIDELSEQEQVSLLLLWKYLQFQPTKMFRFRLDLKKLTEAEKDLLSQKLLLCLWQQQPLPPETSSRIAKIYNMLDKDTTKLAQDMHNLLTHDTTIISSNSGDFHLNKQVLQHKQQETFAVQNILQQIFQETPEEEETTSADLSPLNDAQWAFFQQLASQPRWTLEAAEVLAKSLGLMLMGTLEIINDWSWQVLEQPVAEIIAEEILLDQQLCQQLQASITTVK